MGRGDSNILFNDLLARAPNKRQEEREAMPREPLRERELSDLIYPVVWESVEDIDGERQLNHIKIGGDKKEACQQVADDLARKPIAHKTASLYAEWEEAALASGLYRKVANRLKNRGEVIALWGRLLCSPSRENRSYAIQNHLPALPEEIKKDLLDSLPTPHRLVVKGDQSIRSNPLSGEWSLEAIVLDNSI